MGRIALLAVLAAPLGAGWGRADEGKSLLEVAVPDDKEAALKVLKDWITERGFDCDRSKDVLILKRQGLLINIAPIVTKGELDRLRVVVSYFPKDEYKGSKEFEQLAVKLNRSQNFLQVWVDDNGNLSAGSNLTFYDEMSARLFDAFVDAFAEIVKKYLLTEEAVKLLK